MDLNTLMVCSMSLYHRLVKKCLLKYKGNLNLKSNSVNVPTFLMLNDLNQKIKSRSKYNKAKCLSDALESHYYYFFFSINEEA